mmetsp:Transcript_28973/g.73402  ORF Transcript_28973/g.73402 Transcript_28973/m.73402 type:complete len:143 (-) Transcript_28973:60-488(-)
MGKKLPRQLKNAIEKDGHAWIVICLCVTALKDDRDKGTSGYAFLDLPEGVYAAGMLKVHRVLTDDEFNHEMEHRMWTPEAGATGATYPWNLDVEDERSARVEFWPPVRLCDKGTSQGWWYLTREQHTSLQRALDELGQDGQD